MILLIFLVANFGQLVAAVDSSSTLRWRRLNDCLIPLDYNGRLQRRILAKDRVAAFLVTRESTNFCDPCLARTLGIDPSTAYRAAVKAGRSGGFVREYGVCSECGESRLITRAALEHPA